MQIFVRDHFRQGRCTTLDVARTDKIIDVKYRYCDRLSGFGPPDNIKLILHGSPMRLEDGGTLEDYNIQDQDTIHMILGRSPTTIALVRQLVENNDAAFRIYESLGRDADVQTYDVSVKVDDIPAEEVSVLGCDDVCMVMHGTTPEYHVLDCVAFGGQPVEPGTNFDELGIESGARFAVSTSAVLEHGLESMTPHELDQLCDHQRKVKRLLAEATERKQQQLSQLLARHMQDVPAHKQQEQEMEALLEQDVQRVVGVVHA